MTKDIKTIVVIGGGITGLATTYYLQKKIIEENAPFKVKLIEATYRLGGKVQTYYKDNLIIERGPEAILDTSNYVKNLAKEIGMSDKIVNNVSNCSFVLVGGKLHTLPIRADGGIPLNIIPLATTSLFSLGGKLRATMDFILRRSEPKEDQSLGHFFRRRFGNEVVENMIEPLLSGVYAGDIDRLSLAATFPNFYHMEQQHRSLIIGMKKEMPKRNNNQEPSDGLFINFKSGMQSFIDGIESKLIKGTVFKNTKVEHVSKEADKYVVDLNSGRQIVADSIVVATPHYVTTKIFNNNRSLFKPLEEMPATSVASVSMVFPRSAIEMDVDGCEFVVSRNTDFSITACYLSHKKWPYTTPEDKALIRCYVGRSGRETIVDLSDDQITKIVLEDLGRIMTIKSNPEFSVVSRWKDSMPQYIIGHKTKIDKLNSEMEEQLPGVYLAGSSYEGQNISDCIAQGERVVEKVTKYLQN